MDIFGSDRQVVFTPTVQNAAYSAGNVMGGLLTIKTFRDISIPAGVFTNFLIGSKGGNTGAMTIYIFDTNPTASTITDKTALTLAAADMSKLAMNPFILTPVVPQSGTGAFAEQGQIRSINNGDSPPTQNMYVVIVANGSITPGTTTDIFVKIFLSQD